MPDRSQRLLFVVYGLILFIGGTALFYAIEGAAVVAEIDSTLDYSIEDIGMRERMRWDAHYQGLHEYYYPDNDWSTPHDLFGINHHPAGDLLWLFGSLLFLPWFVAVLGMSALIGLPLLRRRKAKPETQAKNLRVTSLALAVVIVIGLINYMPTIHWIAEVLD